MIPGSWEWLLILIVALLLFGQKLPMVMRNLGSSLNEFKKGMNDSLDKNPEEKT